MRQTGNNNLIWHLSCQQDDQIWRIEMKMQENCEFLHNWHLKINLQKWKCSKSVFHRLVNLFTVRFLCLIVRLWDCPQNRETWEVCSWMGGGVFNALTNLCMVLYCHENSVQKYKNKEQKYNEKFNKAMHKFVRVLDKYGWWGGYVCSLSEFQIRLFPILRSRPCSSARLVFTHVTISSSLMLLFRGHVAKKMCNNRLHICVKLLTDVRY